MPVISARLLGTDEAKPRQKPFELSDSRLPGFILRVQPSGVRTYYAQIRRGLRVKLGKVGELLPDEAREICKQALGNAAHGRAPLHGIGPEPNTITLAAFIGEPEKDTEAAEGTWTLWAQANRKKSWRNTLYLIREFSTWLELPLASINASLIETWKTKALASGSPASTVRRKLDALAGILTRAIKQGLIAVHPMDKVEKPKLDSRPRVRYLSLAEERRLRTALTERDTEMIAARDRWNKVRSKRARLPKLLHYGDHFTPAVLLAMATGMRRSELLRLRWRDIDKVITVELTKGVDTRHQPITDEAKEVLRKWREQSKPASDDDHVLPVRDNLRRSWLSMMKRAGIAKFTWRDLRHQYASAVLQEGGELNTVRELLGHKEIRTTLRYAHLRPADKENAASLLNKRLQRVLDDAKPDE